jgi:hypothetical protein
MGFKNIAMDRVIIVDVKIPQSVRIGSGFLLKTVLRTDLKVEKYEVIIRGISHIFNNTFQEVHLFSDGAINSTIANDCSFLIDYHFVRFQANIKPGKYSIFWSLREIETGKPILTEKGEDSILLGTLYYLPDGLPPYASGIDWDGTLPQSLRDSFAEEFTENPEVAVFSFITNTIKDELPRHNGLSLYAYEQKYQVSPRSNFVYLTVSGKNLSLHWGCMRKDLKTAVKRNITKIKMKNGFNSILEGATENLTIKLEIITKEIKINRRERKTMNMSCRGLKLACNQKSHILLPSEAYKRRLLSFGQQLAYLTALHGIESPNTYSCHVLESTGHTFHQGRICGFYG